MVRPRRIALAMIMVLSHRMVGGQAGSAAARTVFRHRSGSAGSSTAYSTTIVNGYLRYTAVLSRSSSIRALDVCVGCKGFLSMSSKKTLFRAYSPHQWQWSPRQCYRRVFQVTLPFALIRAV